MDFTSVSKANFFVPNLESTHSPGDYAIDLRIEHGSDRYSQDFDQRSDPDYLGELRSNGLATKENHPSRSERPFPSTPSRQKSSSIAVPIHFQKGLQGLYGG